MQKRYMWPLAHCRCGGMGWCCRRLSWWWLKIKFLVCGGGVEDCCFFDGINGFGGLTICMAT